MASALEQVLGDYHGINPDTLEIERVTRTDYRTLVREGQEVVPEQLSTGRAAEMEIEDLFGLRDVAFVPKAMRGTVFESMAIEE